MKKLVLISFLSLFLFCLSFALTEKELIDIEQRIEKIETKGVLSETEKEDLDKLRVSIEPEAEKHPPQEPLPNRSFIQIGSGTTYGAYPSYYGDFCNFWENCHTQTLYLSSELGEANTFTHLQWEYERLSEADPNNVLNVVIKIQTTTDVALTPGAFYDMTGATTVWTNADYVPATAVGWADMVDITDYVYDGTSNLIVDILWGDNGAYGSPYYRHMRTDGGVTRQLLGYADSETPPNYDNATNWYANIRFYYTIPGEPGLPTNPDPANGAIDIAGSGNLTWDWGVDSETYDLWLGETGNMIEVVSGGTVSGPSGSYAYSGLNYSTGYEWQVIVHNSTRVTTNGPVWNFTTGYPPDYVFESFENAVPPTEAGWQVQNIVGNDWAQYSTTTAPDGGKVARLYYTSTTGAQSRLVTPKLSITNTYDFIDFYCRYYSAGTLTIQYSPDATTWTTLEVIPITTTFAQYTVDVSSLVTRGEYYLGFLGETGTSYSYIYLDAVHHPPIVVGGPPDPPSNPDPADDAINVSGVADLLWTNGFGTETVDVYFDTDETLVTNKDASVKVIDNLDVNTYDPGTMLYSTEYFWRVICKNSARLETDGPVWSFTTQNDPNFGGGGAGSGGYYFANSLATTAPSYPTYNWIDNTGHTDVPIDPSMTANQDGFLSDDDFEGPFPIGFTFPFFTGTRGGNFTEFYIQSNGLLSFDATEISFTNYEIPIDAGATDFIAWFWDDMDADDPDVLDTEVTYYSCASCCIITFWHYPEYAATAGDYITAQVILFPNGNIRFQYNEAESGPAPSMDYTSNTIGIEGDIAAVANGIQYRYNNTGGPMFGSDLALAFGLDENNLDDTIILPPDAPINLTITTTPNGSDTDVHLEWDPVTGATSYTVYKSSNPYATFPDDWDTQQSGITNTYYDYTSHNPPTFYRVTANN